MHFEIKDSGIGMSQEQIAKVFNPFAQADGSITRKYGGTGLGLTITKNLVDLMGGTLEVASTPGVGSRFAFELKFNTVNSLTQAVPSKNEFHIIEKPMFKGKVLICEDNLMNQQVVCKHLAKVGLETVVANNGREGVDIVAARMQKGEEPFDLIFMDIHMPVMDGLDAATKITELGVKTPIVALTANIMANDLEHYVTSGMVGYVGKPFSTQELWSCLLEHLTPVSSASVDKYIQRIEEETFLKQLQLNFVKSSQNTCANIKTALDQGDIKLAHRLAHTLKGTAGQIGEKRLQEAAAVTEGMLLDEKNLLTAEQMHTLEMELTSVLEKLAPMLAESDASSKPVMTDREQIRELLARLEPMLTSRNPECMNLIDDLRAIPGAEELVRHIEEFEFKQALAALTELTTAQKQQPDAT
jgi:CheY-like chemotaxis protein